MKQRNPRAGGARASGSHRADDAGNPNTKSLNPQLLVLTSGGLLDHDSAADALVWGRALEADAAYFLRRRRA